MSGIDAPAGVGSACPVCDCARFVALCPVDRDYAERVAARPLDPAAIEVRECAGCGHRMLVPAPSGEFLRAFYGRYMAVARSGFYANRATPTIPGSFRARYEPWLRSARSRHGEGARLLDVGAGTGMFLRLAAEFGFSVEGIEPDQDCASRLAQRYGIPVHATFLENFSAEKPFDIVTMWDLLEHLPDPLGALRAASQLLCRGGTLGLEAPVSDSLVNRLALGLYRVSGGRVRRPLHLVYGVHHLHYFSRSGLLKVLEDSGFGILEQASTGTDLDSLRRALSGNLIRRMRIFAYNATLTGLFRAARLLRSENKVRILAAAG